MRLMRFALVLGTTGVALVGASPAAGEKPSFGCGPGFNLGAVTFSDYLQLPRTQAAIADGLIDAAGILAGLVRVDQNGNEVICVQLQHGGEVNSRPFGEYFYNIVDDNASTP